MRDQPGLEGLSDSTQAQAAIPRRETNAGTSADLDANGESVVRELLARLAECLPREAGPAVEQQVLARFRILRKSRSRMWAYVGGVAACLVFSAALLIGSRVWRHRPAPATQATPDSSLTAAGFVVLPYGQNDVPLEQPVIVRVNIQSAGGSVNADLLVGQDGMARAIRLVK